MATNNAVNTSLSGQTGTGSFVGSTSPTLVTPTLGAATATSLAFSSTSGIIGTTTNNNAAAGSVGQLISSVILSSSPVSFTSTVTKDLTSISLTAGDWDVYGNFTAASSAAAAITSIAWLSLTSVTIPDSALYSFAANIVGVTAFTLPYFRASLSGTTTIFLSAQIGAAGTLTGTGGIYARRVR